MNFISGHIIGAGEVIVLIRPIGFNRD